MFATHMPEGGLGMGAELNGYERRARQIAGKYFIPAWQLLPDRRRSTVKLNACA